MSATLANKAVTQVFPDAEWKPGKGYRIHLLITRDDVGCYSAIALNLPGAGSCGETEEEAVESAKDAIRLALESYEASGEVIPWKDTSAESIPPGAKQRWIILNA
jgi:predicted RNase H-like HicB family nuclease